MAFKADREIPGTDLTPDPLLRKGEATETRVAMNALIQHSSVARLWALVLLCAIAAQALAQNKLPARSPLHFADYDSEPRRTGNILQLGQPLLGPFHNAFVSRPLNETGDGVVRVSHQEHH